MAKKGSTVRKSRAPDLPFKIVVEKHADGYVAYPLGVQGVVVGQGDTYEDALADVKSAIRFHIETFAAMCCKWTHPCSKRSLPRRR